MSSPPLRKKVLFVCTGNAGRSQMAEAMFKDLTSGRFEVLSAGVEPWDDLHPMALKLMAERGLDLTGRHPKHVRKFADEDLEIAITIGDRAEAESPDFRTGVRRLHWAIGDPADADGTADSEAVFRSTCRQIADRLPDLDLLLTSLSKRIQSSWVPAISTAIFGSGQFRPAEHIPLLVKAGFRHMDLCCYADNAHFPWETPSAVAELKRVAVDHGVIIVSVHPPDRSNLASPDQTERGAQIDVVRRFVDLAAELGAASVSIHAGFELPEGAERAAALARQDEALDELETYAAPSPVILCLETLSGRPADAANEDIIEMARRRSAAAFGLVLDTGHPNIAGDLAGLAERAGRRLQNLHLHDNDGSGDQHRIPGEGTIDWPAFTAELLGSGYEGPLTLEVIPTDPAQPEAELARCRRSIDALCSGRAHRM